MRTTMFLLALASSACVEGTSVEDFEPPHDVTHTTLVTADPADRAQEIFAQRCSACHGATGRGDGAVAANLDPHPRNFHDATWQQTVTDDYLIHVIEVGGAAVGKSAAMPANADLDVAVATALKDHIRVLGTQP